MNICWHSFSDSTRKGRCSGCRKGNECTAYHFGIVGHAGDLKVHERSSFWPGFAQGSQQQIKPHDGAGKCGHDLMEETRWKKRNDLFSFDCCLLCYDFFHFLCIGQRRLKGSGC